MLYLSSRSIISSNGLQPVWSLFQLQRSYQRTNKTVKHVLSLGGRFKQDQSPLPLKNQNLLHSSKGPTLPFTMKDASAPWHVWQHNSVPISTASKQSALLHDWPIVQCNVHAVWMQNLSTSTKLAPLWMVRLGELKKPSGSDPQGLVFIYTRPLSAFLCSHLQQSVPAVKGPLYQTT
jgi:hypothetical protein